MPRDKGICAAEASWLERFVYIGVLEADVSHAMSQKVKEFPRDGGEAHIKLGVIINTGRRMVKMALFLNNNPPKS